MLTGEAFCIIIYSMTCPNDHLNCLLNSYWWPFRSNKYRRMYGINDMDTSVPMFFYKQEALYVSMHPSATYLLQEGRVCKKLVEEAAVQHQRQ